MFVVCRKIPGKSKSRVSICKSERNGKKVIQKTIKYFGIAHGEEQRVILVDQARKELARLNTSLLKTKPIISSEEIPSDFCDGALLGHTVERFRITEGLSLPTSVKFYF